MIMKHLCQRLLNWLAPAGWEDEAGFHYASQPKLRNALALILALSLSASAGTVRLVWNASPDVVQGYRIYAGTNSPVTVTNAVGVIDVGTNRTASVTATNAGRWYFMATAYANGVESDPSNEIAVVFPAPPRTLATVAIESSVNATNWMEIYRLKITTP